MLLSSHKLAELLFIVFILSLNNKDVIPSTAGSIMALTNISSSIGNAQLEKISPSISSSKNETAGKILRLKELLDEVKFLANEIKQERRRKRKEKQTSRIESSSSNSVEFRTMNREIRKLRKKMHSKFERIEERMKEMEEKIREQRKIIKKLAIQNGRSKSKNSKKKEKKNNSTSTLAPNINGEVHKVEIKRRGYEGNSCKTHNDCIPGHCCKKLDSTNSMDAVCTFYDRIEGENCEHSCACGAQLQCFKANGAEAKPYCKKASSTDLLNGFYENSKQIF